uniref:Uncharacterized protein n=1 Tax=Sphaerodactylus townsendi TaxID=933632 RepID=A0ACB8FCE3_9SAUR
MAGTDGMTSGQLTDEPDEGTGQVPDKDEIPRDPDLGDKEKDMILTWVPCKVPTVRRVLDHPTLGPLSVAVLEAKAAGQYQFVVKIPVVKPSFDFCC